MKKIMFFISLLALVIACNNSQTASNPQTPSGDASGQAAMPKSVSQTAAPDAEQALAAFRAKDNSVALRYISSVAEEMNAAKSAGLSADADAQFEGTANALQELQTKVQAGEVTDADMMSEILAHANMLTAHGYLILTQAYAVSNPEKADVCTQMAEHHIEMASNVLKGDAQQTCRGFLANVRTSLARGDQKADAIGNAAGRQVIKMTQWLGDHARKLGIKPPARKI